MADRTRELNVFWEKKTFLNNPLYKMQLVAEPFVHLISIMSCTRSFFKISLPSSPRFFIPFFYNVSRSFNSLFDFLLFIFAKRNLPSTTRKHCILFEKKVSLGSISTSPSGPALGERGLIFLNSGW